MPAKRVLISVDERILARIDEEARRSGMTRSGFLAQAAMAQIEGGRPVVHAKAKDALAALDELSQSEP
jgi:metal-responsive CopG/Arc/MetJ family transcriptional regulator